MLLFSAFHKLFIHFFAMATRCLNRSFVNVDPRMRVYVCDAASFLSARDQSTAAAPPEAAELQKYDFVIQDAVPTPPSPLLARAHFDCVRRSVNADAVVAVNYCKALSSARVTQRS
jgi:hypothetical protein